MLDRATKKQIDDLRNILVGKIPIPESQVAQITIGLIYKFMHDMDEISVEMGGKPSFFTGEYEKYAWKNLFDPRLEGVDRMNLYSEAIEKMHANPSAPALFREIFKDARLPFKDVKILNMFLKEINGFHYSHSEKLGDAFEYLLSKMDSQGDAGQFRTPRHIIDFIVEIVSPQKNERILDPACGTAGFLISSYKHIQKQNTEKKFGDKLSAADRKRLGENLVGYDISHEMTRISVVNMYLHKFVTPKIHEYDTLSSEDRWNEYYDVILANPPFFSPTGGIQPHSRFGVQSKRAEVLFVDYIMEHLRPNGRAGIIVPEGIIFQVGKAYKTLRKKLVEDCLVGVISLPAGVFNPYSGVRTSVLILNKERSQKSDSIFFAKVENDGFSLGAQRNQIDKNDLPSVLEAIRSHNSGQETNLQTMDKSIILQNKDISLNHSIYKATHLINSEFETVKLVDYVDFQKGKSITRKDVVDGSIPVIAGGKQPAYFHNQENREANSITISSSGDAGFVSFHPYPIFASDCFTVASNSQNLDQKFLFYLLKSKQEAIYSMQSGSTLSHIYPRDFNNFKIPLPPIEIQQQIVDELDGYQKIIDGCRQAVENYKPTIDIDPSWEMVELKNVSEINMGQSPSGEYYNHEGDGLEFHQGKIKFTDLYVEHSGVWASQYNKIADKNSILMSVRAPVGPVNITKRKIALGRGLCGIQSNGACHQMFLFHILQSLKEKLTQSSSGSTFDGINKNQLSEFKIPLPPIERQQEIADELERQQKRIDAARELVKIHEEKIQKRISKVWGE